MTTWGAKEIQKEHPSNPYAYYFAYPAVASVPDNGGPQQKSYSTKLVLTPLIDILGHYKTETAWGWDDSYYVNDGMVNTVFARAPRLSKSVDYKEGMTPQRGVWVNMPELKYLEHSASAGFFQEKNKTYEPVNVFIDHSRYVESLS